MKSSVYLLSLLLGGALAWSQGTAQSPPPKPAQSGSTSTSPSSTNPNSTNPAAATQLKPRGPEAVAQTDPNRVVATIGGKQITAKEALELLKPISAEDRKRYETKLSQLVQQVYMEDELAAEATKMNLDQQSPWKEQLQLARANILTQAYLNRMSSTPNPSGAAADDPKQYYDTHPNEFDQVKLDGIFVAFSAPGTPTAANAAITRTEQDARTKADDLEKKIKAGGDFAALARSDSDNQASAARGGELGVFSLADPNLPPDVKAAMMKLQPGEVSEPIRIPNGFYILKLVSRNKIPFDQARASIVQKMQNDKNQAVLRQELDKYKIEVQDPDFFNAAAAPVKIPSLQKPAAPQQPATTPVKPPPHS
jgi:hypothetical protein